VFIVEVYAEKAALLKDLDFARSAIEKRITAPVLSHVLLEATGTSLRVSATDLETGARSEFPAKVKTEGTLLVPGLRLFEIVKSAPDGEIHFKATENHFGQVSFGRSAFKLTGLSTDQFPRFPTGAKLLANLDAKLLASSIAKTQFSASPDGTKVAMSGALLVLRKDGLTMVATDGHRLSCIQRPCDLSALAQEHSLLIPRKALACARDLALEDASQKSVTIAMSDTHVFFIRGSRGIFSRMLSGKFPAYEPVLPKGHPYTITLGRCAFADMVRRVKLMADQEVHRVRLSLQNDRLELSTGSGNLGEAKDSLPITYGREPIEVTFNAGYVEEFLDVSSDAPSITIHLKDETSAVEFRPVTEPATAHRYVVMPLRK
jgi:DNA polymerase III subunit beta